MASTSDENEPRPTSFSRERAESPRLARGTLEFELEPELHRHPVELRSLVVETLERIAPADARIRLEAPEALLLAVDEVRIEWVLARMIESASRIARAMVVRLARTATTAIVSVTPGGVIHPTSRAIVDAHGGRFGVTTSSVWFELPFEAAVASTPRLAGRAGLLVGNELPHAHHLATLLRDEGMETLVALTRRDTLREARAHHLDAVVLDADMPNGELLTAELRAALPDLLIVVVTSRRLECHEPIVLHDPTDAGELFAVITRRLGAERAR